MLGSVTIVEIRERGFIEHIPTVKGDQRLYGGEVRVGPEALGLLDGARGVEYHTRLYTHTYRNDMYVLE